MYYNYNHAHENTSHMYIHRLCCVWLRRKCSRHSDNEDDNIAVLNYHGLNTPPEIEGEAPSFTTGVESDFQQ